jgi:hypothetical protein
MQIDVPRVVFCGLHALHPASPATLVATVDETTIPHRPLLSSPHTRRAFLLSLAVRKSTVHIFLADCTYSI